jgi:hypothetical protein
LGWLSDVIGIDHNGGEPHWRRHRPGVHDDYPVHTPTDVLDVAG